MFDSLLLSQKASEETIEEEPKTGRLNVTKARSINKAQDASADLTDEDVDDEESGEDEGGPEASLVSVPKAPTANKTQVDSAASIEGEESGEDEDGPEAGLSNVTKAPAVNSTQADLADSNEDEEDSGDKNATGTEEAAADSASVDKGEGEPTGTPVEEGGNSTEEKENDKEETEKDDEEESELVKASRMP